MGSQKNHPNETVLLSTQNICQNLWVRKYSQFYAEIFCLSKPVIIEKKADAQYVPVSDCHQMHFQEKGSDK